MNSLKGSERRMPAMESHIDNIPSPENSTDSERNKNLKFLEIIREHIETSRAQGRSMTDPEARRQISEQLQPFLKEGLTMLLKKMAEEQEGTESVLTPIARTTKLVLYNGWIHEVPANTRPEDLGEGAVFWGQDQFKT